MTFPPAGVHGPDRRPVRRRARGIDRGPRGLAEALEDAIAGLAPPPTRSTAAGVATPAGTLGTLFSRWDEIVGPTLARHVRPLTLAGGVLSVAVDRPAWATQVRALGATILARVAEVTGTAGGAPDELRVVVRPDAAAP
ncbi:MAG: DciA family protein [Acidimicrobiales bacterium]